MDKQIKILLQDLLKNKQYDNVLTFLDEFSETEKQDIGTTLFYYKAYMGLSAYDKAELYIDKLLMGVDDNCTFWRDKGLCHQYKEEWYDALHCYDRAIKLRPDIGSYYVAKANILKELDHIEKAIINYQLALERSPEQKSWKKNLAQLFIQNNELLNAYKIYKELLNDSDEISTKMIFKELKKQLENGSKEASSDYYNSVFSTSKKYLETGENGVYHKVWLKIIEIISTNQYTNILDLGCGPGQFAEFIAKRYPLKQYTGVDFSESAIAIAKKRCPEYTFLLKALPDKTLQMHNSSDVVICTEVLEHIEKDIELLQNLDAGTAVIASVPNFHSFGHVRVFKTMEEVKERYSFLFSNIQIIACPLSKNRFIWLLCGKRA